jgi:glycerol-3-phosphate dehydrogenase (NAD(P)+)
VSQLDTLAIVGGGSWGTALARVLAPRFRQVRLWVFETNLAARAEATRVNDVFLPGFRLPDNVRCSSSLEDVVPGAGTVLSVMPSHAVRSVYEDIARLLEPGARLVSATKGLESGSLLRVSDVIQEATGFAYPVAVLSGPTFAREVAAGSPTALVLASAHSETVQELQAAFSGPTFRVYASDDPTGVEIGGALKNVIAIGAGICDGLALGHNAIAALITRGLAEITRIAVTLGAKPETLAGLAGLGDLVLTCTGDLSRNRQVGLQLASGLHLGAIIESTPMVAEGVRTTSVAVDLAERHGVELPICSQMHAVLNLGRSPADAIRALMTRTLRNER